MMTDEELLEIVNSTKEAYTLTEPDYSKVMFALYCLGEDLRERGLARFCPIIKKGTKDMNEYDEQTLQSDKVVELLNEIAGHRRYATEKNDFGIANLLHRCYEMLKNMQVVNADAVRENRSMSDHHRTHFAGLAMQSLLIANKDICVGTTVEDAFGIADEMVKHGKKNSETKCTGDDTGNTPTKNSN